MQQLTKISLKIPLTGQIAPRTYTTGRVEFSVMPIRVQW